MTPNNLKRVPCEVYTRCCGYYRPVKQMNDAKTAEVNDRVTFRIKYDNKN